MRLSKMMQSVSFSILLNIFLALVILINAEAGRLLGIKGLPLEISAVWPPTGFSLAALLLFGYKTWPGIFLGNLIYNAIHLTLGIHELKVAIPAAVAVSLGSLAQGLVGAFIMKKFSSAGYFNTVRDIMLFLFPAGLFTCLIAPSIGVTTLYLSGILPAGYFGYTWLTFFFGDTLGVYILTPLLVVWSLRKPSMKPFSHKLELGIVAILFIIVSWLAFGRTLPVALFYLPLTIWVSYRFKMHGSTIIVFITAFVTIVCTALGYGLLYALLLKEPILILSGYFQAIVLASFLIAAMSNERDLASYQFLGQDVDMQQIISAQGEEFKKIYIQNFIRERRGLLGLLTTGMVNKILTCLKTLDQIRKSCEDLLQNIQNIIAQEPMPPETKKKLQDTLQSIEHYHLVFSKVDQYAQKSAKLAEEQISRTLAGKTTVQLVNINSTLRKCLSQVTNEQARRHPHFTFTIMEDFDKEVQPILALPEELTKAFVLLLHNSVFLMKEKKDRQGAGYDPLLEVHTKNHEEFIEIVIRDNGKGASDTEQKYFSSSFIKMGQEAPEILEDGTHIGLALASDILTYLHEGQIQLKSKEDEFLELTITLARTRP